MSHQRPAVSFHLKAQFCYKCHCYCRSTGEGPKTGLCCPGEIVKEPTLETMWPCHHCALAWVPSCCRNPGPEK
jgi:hypothetical protein